MEQASGSFMTGMRAFSARLPLIPLLWPFTACRFFVYFQVNNGVVYLLYYVEDIYIMALSVLVSILNVAVNTIVPLSPFLLFVPQNTDSYGHEIKCGRMSASMK